MSISAHKFRPRGAKYAYKTDRGGVFTDDTAELLRECNAGIKMGVESIEDVLERVGDGELSGILSRSMREHQSLGSETHALLEGRGISGKEPAVMARGMSWLKTEVMLAAGDDAAAADLITDGCNMGVKSLCRYLNRYAAADEKSKDIAKRLVAIEEQLACDMRDYL